MALMKCPECGNDVFDKAPACVHCGYPLQKSKGKCTISSQLGELKLKLDSFLGNPNMYKNDFAVIFADIKHLTDNIKENVSDCSKEQKVTTNNEVAILIHSALMRGNEYSGWKTTKSYYELIDFNMLPNDILMQMTKDIIAACNYNETMHIMFWYPISQLLYFDDEDIKETLKKCLSKKSALGTKYTDVQNMIEKHLSDDVATQVMRNSIKDSMVFSDQSNSTKLSNIPRCPTCNSTNISRISTGKKAFGFATFGLFSSNFGKTMECKNCGYKW